MFTNVQRRKIWELFGTAIYRSFVDQGYGAMRGKLLNYHTYRDVVFTGADAYKTPYFEIFVKNL